jgi:putative ABC transport system permease protein
MVARIQLNSDRYPDQPSRAQFGARLLENLDRESALDAFGFTSTLPVGDPAWGGRFVRDLADADAGREPLLLHIRRISDGYPEAIGIPLVSGRLFDSRDRAESVPVALLSESAARRLWPDQDAVGKRLYRMRPADTPEALEVIGVLGDVHDGGLSAPAGEAVYLHWPQISVASMSIVVHSRLGESEALTAMQRAIAATDGIMAASNAATLPGLVDQANALPRLQTILLTGFAAIALALLLLGSYGVTMQLVASREREFALRVLFGAPPARVGAAVLAQIGALGLLGAALGTACLWPLSSVLESFAFGVVPRSLPLLLVTTTTVTALGLLAAFAPAVRAMRVDIRKGTAP